MPTALFFMTFMMYSGLLWGQQPVPKTLTIAIADWPPYEYVDTQQKFSGQNVEIVQAVSKKLGYHVIFRQLPWSRCIKYVKEGTVDGILSLYRTKAREAFLYYVDESISDDISVLFTASSNPHTYDGDLKSLTGKTVVIARNNSYGMAFDQATYLKKFDTNNNKQVLQMVRANRYPFGISSKLPLIHLMKTMGVTDKIKILEPPVSSEKLYLGFSLHLGKKMKDLSALFARGLIEFKNSTQFQTIIKNYSMPK